MVQRHSHSHASKSKGGTGPSGLQTVCLAGRHARKGIVLLQMPLAWSRPERERLLSAAMQKWPAMFTIR